MNNPSPALPTSRTPRRLPIRTLGNLSYARASSHAFRTPCSAALPVSAPASPSVLIISVLALGAASWVAFLSVALVAVLLLQVCDFAVYALLQCWPLVIYFLISFAVRMRGIIRERYNINGTDTEDCTVYACCPCCARFQESAELDSRLGPANPLEVTSSPFRIFILFSSRSFPPSFRFLELVFFVGIGSSIFFNLFSSPCTSLRYYCPCFTRVIHTSTHHLVALSFSFFVVLPSLHGRVYCRRIGLTL